VEGYESEASLERHGKSAAIAENQLQNGALRTGEKEVHLLRVVAGYLWKKGNKSGVLFCIGSGRLV
jgi:hypothetical protein